MAMLVKLQTAIDRTFEEAPTRSIALQYFKEQYHTAQVGKLWYVDLDRPLKTIENEAEEYIAAALK